MKMERYGLITEKQKREIVLLRGRGCAYKKCTFCDYHLDACADDRANYALNSAVLDNVTGVYGELEVINSGSVFELDKATLSRIKRLCRDKNIHTLHFESHWLYRSRIPALREEFEDVELKLKLGLETFDCDYRENVLKKGIPEQLPEKISRGFDEANFLFGLTGQSRLSMERDIELGLKYFERICINIMCENSAPVKPDKAVTDVFKRELYPFYKDEPRVDILISNTDFHVG